MRLAAAHRKKYTGSPTNYHQPYMTRVAFSLLRYNPLKVHTTLLDIVCGAAAVAVLRNDFLNPVPGGAGQGGQGGSQLKTIGASLGLP